MYAEIQSRQPFLAETETPTPPIMAANMVIDGQAGAQCFFWTTHLLRLTIISNKDNRIASTLSNSYCGQLTSNTGRKFVHGLSGGELPGSVRVSVSGAPAASSSFCLE